MNKYIEELEAKVKEYQERVRTAKRVISQTEPAIAKHKERLAVAKRIVKDYNSGKYSQHELAKKYDVPRSTISGILLKNA